MAFGPGAVVRSEGLEEGRGGEERTTGQAWLGFQWSRGGRGIHRMACGGAAVQGEASGRVACWELSGNLSRGEEANLTVWLGFQFSCFPFSHNVVMDYVCSWGFEVCVALPHTV